jgi:hypothetical protein
MSCPVCYGPSRDGECRLCLTLPTCDICGARVDYCRGHDECELQETPVKGAS